MSQISFNLKQAVWLAAMCLIMPTFWQVILTGKVNNDLVLLCDRGSFI